MTEKQKQLKIAFTKNDWKYKDDLKDYREQEVWSSSARYKDAENLKDNTPFEATLIYNGFSRGRSALNIGWINHERKLIYYSGMSLLDEVLKQGLVEGNKISGTFCFKKQGTSILLKFAK